MEHMPVVCLQVVTFNNEATIAACLDSLFAQTPFELGKNLFLRVIDNASGDRTPEILDSRAGEHLDVVHQAINTGFTGGQNAGAEWALKRGAEYFCLVNPDLRLESRALFELVQTLEQDSRAGTACPKLLRAAGSLAPSSPLLLDSAGMYMTPALRHFDRGSNDFERGQYDEPQYVFGASGACLLLRADCVRDAALHCDPGEGGVQLFDSQFFAYREDADLAWRLQTLGWKCRYEPRAVGYHQRRVLPENRESLQPELNAYSVRNRFLLQANNFSFPVLLPFLPRLGWRNLLVCGGVLIREQTSVPALRAAWALRSRAARIRFEIQKRRRVPASALRFWFRNEPAVQPALDTRPGDKISTVAVLVVNYNSASRLARCAAALEELTTHSQGRCHVKIVVVDNASSDSSLAEAEPCLMKISGCSILRSERNAGFAAAVNRAARTVEADAYLVLNPDVEMSFGALSALAACLENSANLAAVAPLLRDSQHAIQRDYLVRRFPSLGSALAELFFFHRLWPGNPWTSGMFCREDRYIEGYLENRPAERGTPAESPQRPLVVEQPAAACLLIRCAAFQDIGGFDESFFPAWFEDVDFCKRLARKGWLCAVSSAAEALHEGGYSREVLGNSRFAEIWYGNMLRYFRKHQRPGDYLALRAALPPALFIRSFVSFLRSYAGDTEPVRRERREHARTLLRLAVRATRKDFMKCSG
jgi:GT2 family glycosyltransferase